MAIDEFMVLDCLNIAIRKIDQLEDRWRFDDEIEHIEWARNYLAKAWNRDPEYPGRVLKKPYSKPTLIDYGTLEKLTSSVGNMGNKDNGTGSASRTKP